MYFLYTILYIIGVSILIFLLGRIFPRRWIIEDRFPLRSFKFEKDGRIYNKLRIMKWKDRLPNASVIITKILPGFMPRKKLDESSNLQVLIKETCIAEATHVLAAVFGFGSVFIWKRKGGLITSIIFALLNLPFIIIQRFNRPRLIAAERMMRERRCA